MSFLKKAIGSAVAYKVYKNNQPPTITPPENVNILSIEKKIFPPKWKFYVKKNGDSHTDFFTVNRGTLHLHTRFGKFKFEWD